MTAKIPHATQTEGVTVVDFSEFQNIDDTVLDGVRTYLLEVSQAAEPPCVLLDLSQTNFFGSAFIESLFRVSNRLKQRKGNFGLCGLTKYCAEILQITRLDQLWPIFPDRTAGVQGLKAS